MRDSDKRYVLIGYSGHAFVVAEAAECLRYHIVGYAEREEKKSNPFQFQYMGNENAPDFIGWAENIGYLLGIGDNTIRTKVAQKIRIRGYICTTIVHPESNCSKRAEIDAGTFIARGANINPFVTIGKYCIINTSASIDHECNIQDGAHIAPGAVLAGGVHVGKQAFIGANAVIKEGVIIGDYATIGAGSVVLENVPEEKVFAGNPARILRNKSFL